MLYDRIKSTAVTCNTTGNATWTAAASQYALPPAGITNKWVNYTLLDSGGTKWETGHAQLSESAGTYTLTRGGSQIVTESTNAGAAESFTNSSAHTLVLAPDAQFFNNAEILLDKQIASTSASIDFDLPAGFDEYIVRIRGCRPATDNTELYMPASINAGSTYLNTSGDYWYAHGLVYQSATYTDVGSTTDTVGIEISTDQGNDTVESLDATIHITNCASTALYKMVRYDTLWFSNVPNLYRGFGGGSIRTTSAVDAIQFKMGSGNIAEGDFKLYGIVE